MLVSGTSPPAYESGYEADVERALAQRRELRVGLHQRRAGIDGGLQRAVAALLDVGGEAPAEAVAEIALGRRCRRGTGARSSACRPAPRRGRPSAGRPRPPARRASRVASSPSRLLAVRSGHSGRPGKGARHWGSAPRVIPRLRRRRRLRYSALMPACLTTAAQRAASRRISAAISSGELGATSMPCAASAISPRAGQAP